MAKILWYFIVILSDPKNKREAMLLQNLPPYLKFNFQDIKEQKMKYFYV